MRTLEREREREGEREELWRERKSERGRKRYKSPPLPVTTCHQ